MEYIQSPYKNVGNPSNYSLNQLQDRARVSSDLRPDQSSTTPSVGSSTGRNYPAHGPPRATPEDTRVMAVVEIPPVETGGERYQPSERSNTEDDRSDRVLLVCAGSR